MDYSDLVLVGIPVPGVHGARRSRVEAQPEGSLQATKFVALGTATAAADGHPCPP